MSYTREQAEEVLRDLNEFLNHGKGIFSYEKKFLNHKFPELNQEAALIKEAKSRGFKEGVTIGNTENDHKGLVLPDSKFYYQDFDNTLWLTNVKGSNMASDFTIMKDGIWAEIVEEEKDLTAEQANEALQTFAKWFGDNYKKIEK